MFMLVMIAQIQPTKKIEVKLWIVPTI